MNQAAFTKLLLANQARMAACEQELKKAMDVNNQLLSAMIEDEATRTPSKEQVAAAESSLAFRKRMNQRKPKNLPN